MFRPEPGKAVPGIGDVHQDEDGDETRIQQVGLVVQSHEDEQVVAQQRQQVAVQKTVAVSLFHFLVRSLFFREQENRHHDRIIGFDAQVDIRSAGIEFMLKREKAFRERALAERQAVAGMVTVDGSAIPDKIDIEVIEPGILDLQLPVQGLVSGVVHRQVYPHRFGTNAEREDGMSALREFPRGITLDCCADGKLATCFLHERRIFAQRLIGLYVRNGNRCG